MLKMIIADDEYRIRRGLCNVLPWKEYDIEVVAEASNGKEAFELCQQHVPDILLLDIKMPLMDGLEVAIMLKEAFENRIRIIFISGIEDFSYVKTALDIDAEGYILKPVKIDELKNMITKVVNRIHVEKNSEDMLSRLKMQLHENFAVMRERFLANLITNHSMKEQDVWEKVEYFSLPFSKYEPFMAAVLQIDEYEAATVNSIEESKQLLTFSVSNIIEEILGNYKAGVWFTHNENEFVLILNGSMLINGNYTEVFEEMVSCINKILKISVSIGIGSQAGSILTLNASFKEALLSLKYKYFTGSNSIIDIRDVACSTLGMEYTNLYQIENDIMTSLKLGENEQVAAKIEEIFTFLTSKKETGAEYVQSICIELVSITQRSLFELKIDMEGIVGKHSLLLEHINRTKNIFELKRFMLDTYHILSTYFSKKHVQKNDKLISKVEEYIQHHYMEDISITDIAREVFLSANYIGLLFKQETGVTITEYLTRVRIETAKQLLRTTDLKILEVAEKVGYENSQYFSTVFKKHTGVYPQMFRSCQEE